MSTCITCRGRIDAEAYQTKRRIAEKLNKRDAASLGPPKRCTECTLLAMLAFAFDEESTPEPGKEP